MASVFLKIRRKKYECRVELGVRLQPDDLVPGAGVAICLEDIAYAVFYLPEHPQQVFVVEHKDPFSGASAGLGIGV